MQGSSPCPKMSSADVDRVWIKWLPPDVQRRVLEEEPTRFAALVAGFAADVQIAESSSAADPWQSISRWLPLLGTHLKTKRSLSSEPVTQLVHALWRTTLASSADLEVQARCAQVLVDTLQAHKHKLQLELPWRPLYQLMLQLFGHPVPRLEGMGLAASRANALLKLAGKARRFFPSEAAAQIWDTLRPAIEGRGSVSDRYEALGWMSSMWPTHNISRLDPTQLNSWVAQFMSCWASIVHSHGWDAMWQHIVASMAKYDHAGVIVWQPHLPHLFASFMSTFEVPVGNASGDVPVRRSAPYKAMVLFVHEMSGHSFSTSRALVHLLRSAPGADSTALAQGHAEAALVAFEQLAMLLEQYAHPSNGGKWSREIAGLLKYSTKTLMKQLAAQQQQEQAANVAGTGGTASLTVVGPQTQHRFVAALIKLADRAQFSKDASLSSTAVKALGQLAYLEPAAVLPLVLRRFQAALDTATAMHQLSASIDTLALCVRPMLLSGWGSEDEPAPQLLSEALMAVLPGIDANDEGKTTAVLHFYLATLSSLPTLCGVGDEDDTGAALSYRLPLYVEEWADELMRQILQLLQNLDSGPGHRSDQGSAGGGTGMSSGFLHNGQMLFWTLSYQLFEKLPRSVGERLSRQLAHFALTNTLPGLWGELCGFIAEAVEQYPDVFMEALIKPLIARLKEDLPEIGSPAAVGQLSQSLEIALSCQLRLLHESLHTYPGHAVLPLLPQIEELLARAFGTSSRQVHMEAAGAVGGVVHLMTRYYCDPSAKSGGGAVLPTGLAAWIDKTGQAFTPLKWVDPSAAELQAAQQLIQRHLLDACAELTQLCGGAAAVATDAAAGATTMVAVTGGQAVKVRLHALLSEINGMLGGLMSTLTDFYFGDAVSRAGTPIGVVGGCGVVVGESGIREKIAAALTLACKHLAGGEDPESLSVALIVAGTLLCNGGLEYGSQVAMKQELDHGLTEFVKEPAVAGQYLPAGSVWRKRCPRWATLMRVMQQLGWRTSQAAFRSWATDTAPELSSAAQVPFEFRALLSQILGLTMHPISIVRDEAVVSMEATIKRFPTLVTMCLPHLLAAFANIAPPVPIDSTAVAAAPTTPAEAAAAAAAQKAFFKRLEDAFANAVVDAGGSAAAAAPAVGTGGEGVLAAAAAFAGSHGGAGVAAAASALANLLGGAGSPTSGSSGAATARSESERDGRVIGAVRALSTTLSFWRFIFRDPTYFAAMLHALLASRVHNATTPQSHLSNLFVSIASRFLHPPSLKYSSPEYTHLSEALLAAAKPGGLKNATWRYSLMANVMSILLLPPAGEPSAIPMAGHLLTLLDSEMLPLRQIAGAGLYFQLSAIDDFGISNDGVMAAVAAHAASEGMGERMLSHLALGHTKLDAQDAMKDKRGANLLAMQSRLMNMTFEDILTRMVQATVDKLTKWPVTDNPHAVNDGLFVVGNARLVQLLSAAAPVATLASLRPALESRLAVDNMQAHNTSEKAEQAACAEVVAGLLAAGVPFLPEADGGWLLPLVEAALRHTTLEMADAWAVALRFGVKGLLEATMPSRQLPLSLLRPEAQLPHITRAASITSASIAPRLGGLQQILELLLQPPAGGVATVGASGAALGAGASTSALPSELKRLRYLNQVVYELTAVPLAAEELPQQVLQFWSRALSDLSSLLATDVFSLRDHLAFILVKVLSYFGGAALGSSSSSDSGLSGGLGSFSDISVDSSNDNEIASLQPAAPMDMEVSESAPSAAPEPHGSASHLRSQARALAQQLLTAFAEATRAVQAFRPTTDSHVTTATASAVAGASTLAAVGDAAFKASAAPAGGPSTPALELADQDTSHGDAATTTSSKAGSVLGDIVMVELPTMNTPPTSAGSSDEELLLADPDPLTAALVSTGVDPLTITDAIAATPVSGTTAGEDEQLSLTISQLGLGFYFVIAAMRDGDLVALRELLLAMLPRLFQLQELAGPLLQKLAGEAQMAFVLIKYLPLPQPSLLAAALSMVTRAASSELWSERAAAVLYLQYTFWAHAYSLRPQQFSQLLAVVVPRLSDSKAEVRGLAAATLSGLLKLLPPAQICALRNQLLAQAKQLFSRQQRKRAADTNLAVGNSGGTLLEKQGVVQGLKAFVLSSPYDCPDWMPEVLMALVPAAGSSAPAALKSDVSKALSEFKRTHEQDSMAVLKAALDSDQWDSLQQVTSTATYFT